MGLALSFPGELFGRTSHYESYAYVVLKQYSGWSIRRYAPAVAAEVTSGNSDDRSFMRLAKYIGVFSTPENEARSMPNASEAIAMTTPVISEPIAMTTPVVSTKNMGSSSMRFVLPSKYTRACDAPMPTDAAVRLVDIPAKTVAAIQFSGRCEGCDAAAEKYEELCELLKQEGLTPSGTWELHRFNPPYTLAPFRTNEVLVPLAEQTLASAGIQSE
mmetsp:Transcript_46509/g.73507  ORF Transcript_46509/g.73507 Transcript_46509/m.73507 type:complete len:216 (+) Transcript_46509:60-707(+)|eukprot:CAMPEP_0169122880 /NCGR_PEP_ID=MMETSP1015-20121227/33474_1 /TAXON_ID=342587 /ORGANISM="Karlodinium micrum, Strain CCMP2283" /LENGTH=215 /DNA_ID=CAMNT_0009186153 /DNA_START=60 /DNA_END=707 /DNA_ORIENTATION=+